MSGNAPIVVTLTLEEVEVELLELYNEQVVKMLINSLSKK